MKIIAQNKKNWHIVKEIKPDGTEIILSGYAGLGEFYSWSIASTLEELEVGSNVLIQGRQFQAIDNIIFEASIKPTQASRGRSSTIIHWSDKDGFHKYQSGVQSSLSFFQAISRGEIKIDIDGYMVGIFTFRKQGSETYIYPYGEK